MNKGLFFSLYMTDELPFSKAPNSTLVADKSVFSAVDCYNGFIFSFRKFNFIGTSGKRKNNYQTNKNNEYLFHKIPPFFCLVSFSF